MLAHRSLASGHDLVTITGGTIDGIALNLVAPQHINSFGPAEVERIVVAGNANGNKRKPSRAEEWQPSSGPLADRVPATEHGRQNFGQRFFDLAFPPQPAAFLDLLGGNVLDAFLAGYHERQRPDRVPFPLAQ